MDPLALAAGFSLALVAGYVLTSEVRCVVVRGD